MVAVCGCLCCDGYNFVDYDYGCALLSWHHVGVQTRMESTMSKHRLAKFTGAVAGTIAGIFTRPDYLSTADQIRVLEQRIGDLEKDNHNLLAFRNAQTDWDYKIIGYIRGQK